MCTHVCIFVCYFLHSPGHKACCMSSVVACAIMLCKPLLFWRLGVVLYCKLFLSIWEPVQVCPRPQQDGRRPSTCAQFFGVTPLKATPNKFRHGSCSELPGVASVMKVAVPEKASTCSTPWTVHCRRSHEQIGCFPFLESK